MTPIAAPPRSGHGWQLILADLALILFLLTLTALPADEPGSAQRPSGVEARTRDPRPGVRPDIAAAQALYRPVPAGPTLAEWLRAQAPDPRATLTIFALHASGGEARAWTRAEALAAEARASGARVRTIISPGAADEIYASLAYDAVVAEAEGRAGDADHSS